MWNYLVVLPSPKSALCTEKLAGSKSISLRAILDGGPEENSVQTNTQLFKHSQSPSQQLQMTIKVKFQADVSPDVARRYKNSENKIRAASLPSAKRHGHVEL